jgi:hypothetical protein
VRVAEEMEFLYHAHDCSIFLFQDDDFPFTHTKDSEWMKEFCLALEKKGLVGKVMWKVNCRPDEIESETIMMVKEHGLYRIYLGIEDGTDSGLQQLNKRQHVSDNISAIHILKEHGVNIDFGFMLFQPTTTYQSLFTNLDFLDKICNDGYMPVTFLKMLPYFGTKIEQELRKKHRLTGKPGFLDYDYEDASLNKLHRFIFDIFNRWLNAPEGVSNVSKLAKDYISVFSFYNGSRSGVEDLSRELDTQVSEANMFVVETLKELSEMFESGKYLDDQDKVLDNYRYNVQSKHDAAFHEIKRIIGKIELFNLTKALFSV